MDREFSSCTSYRTIGDPGKDRRSAEEHPARIDPDVGDAIAMDGAAKARKIIVVQKLCSLWGIHVFCVFHTPKDHR